MTDIIILVVVVLVLVLAVKSSIKHFKGEGACCGGSKGLISGEKEKVLKNPKMGEKVLQIEGMHCDHCKQSVTQALNNIEGAAAKVELQKNRAVVSYDRPIEAEVLRKAVEKAGFRVVSIQ